MKLTEIEFMFGKNKGQKVCDTESNYLHWITNHTEEGRIIFEACVFELLSRGDEKFLARTQKIAGLKELFKSGIPKWYGFSDGDSNYEEDDLDLFLGSSDPQSSDYTGGWDNIN